MKPRVRPALPAKLALSLVGLLVGLSFAEVALRVFDLPKTYMPRKVSRQFAEVDAGSDYASVGYVNLPSAVIRFGYDGNPRGYFDADGSIRHRTNSDGFRGAEFSASKARGVFRIAFVGDSFTFGEGVQDGDTFVVRAQELLEARLGQRKAEALNFGVGGFNTVQEEALIRLRVLDRQTDCVVLGFTINDPEPPIYQLDEKTGKLARRSRGALDRVGAPAQPSELTSRLRIIQLMSLHSRNRSLTHRVLQHYRELYREEAPGWKRAQAALKGIAASCAAEHVPCYVLVFPYLHGLDAYPFEAEHRKILEALEQSGLPVIDLLPDLRGREQDELWVHPTDPHPNEKVHALAARRVVERLERDGVIPPVSPGDG